MASIDQAPTSVPHSFSRLRRNVSWLLGGKGFGGLISIVYLAAAARALGPYRFGIFALVLTYAQLLANLVQFQSWKGVIRFGATHAADNAHDPLARLLGYTAMLDWSAALAGTLVAALGVVFAGPVFGWSADVQKYAAIFAAALLLTTGATPSGMLRLFDRFDLLAYAEASSPLIRLFGAVLAWIAGGGIAAFLAVWVAAAFVQMAITWIAALRLHKIELARSRSGFRRVMQENPGVWRFMWQASLSSSLGFVWMQAGVLAVGAFAGPVMAGGYRLADRIASAIAKPAETITRALYPELAHLVAKNDRASLSALVKRTVLLSLAIAILIVLFCTFEGRLILQLVAGRRYAFAQPFLAVLAISAGVDVAGFVLEPVLNAHGKSANVLLARIIGASLYAVLLIVLLFAIGPVGAAIAAAVSCAVMVGLLAYSARGLFSKE